MIKIIETNLSLDENDNIKDHQSRVIEVESWNSYIDEMKESRTVIRDAIIGSMHGISLPHDAKVDNLVYDDFHMSCNITSWRHIKSKKLAYIIR